MGMEIERKFVPKYLPDNLEQYESLSMAQGYLNTHPVVRIRKSNDEYYLTYKGGGMMAREEYNLPLNAESFEHMLPKVDGLLIEKTRYNIPLSDGHMAELDIFHGTLEPLRIVEVEFESVEEAESFTPPEWFGEDVTNDHRYHNSNISRNGFDFK